MSKAVVHAPPSLMTGAQHPADDQTSTASRPILDQTNPDADEKIDAGTMVRDYIIGDIVGDGGCGTIYRAEHRILRRAVAFKVIHRHLVYAADMLKRFEREAWTMAQLRHPNIVELFDYGELVDGRPYMVMELLDGKDLDAVVGSLGRIAAAELPALLEPVCAALEAAHEIGVVHRDLKASNVFLANTESGPTVKLLDFGVAKLLTPPSHLDEQISTNRIVGTPTAMAPEQILGGAVDARTDIYALGVLTFELLTGHVPFGGSSPFETERMHLESPPPRPSALVPTPPAIDEVVLRAMQKDPNDRFPTVREFWDALSRATTSSNHAPKGGQVQIRVEATIPNGADIELQDAVEEALVEATQLAQEAAFDIVLVTATALVVARVADRPDERARVSQEAVDLTMAFHEILFERLADSVAVSVTVQRGDVSR